ncbi:hypothetical protein AcW1_001870 [Taiwanofungus camphoratus]|nr:hypothetical protein AcW1_001870 [Antrodia cinnamomea]
MPVESADLLLRIPSCITRDPEPTEHDVEVPTGDVRHIGKGRFHRIFNTLLPATHSINRLCDVPDGFEQLQLEKHFVRKERAIEAGSLHGRSITTIKANAHAQA